ncbi:hypothetical protein DTL42_22025 [Bremerella cremea]|uniref:Uncharacterized protein n=1 Tax=Bremerella cremea TaxID=1031537 RepID=A0A368KKH1_9BACT|nr:hypothetical protein [Bremerella cremea]RCS41249.1 hypothetical protein DTL42_22025 [Bremerella cremea]
MPSRPSLLDIRYWENHERRVLEAITLALNKLSREETLPQNEDRLNRKLYFYILEAIREMSQRGMRFTTYPMYEANNQPQVDDVERAAREGKRPDFQFGYIDHYETNVQASAKQYVVECKRLGESGRSDWVLNVNYLANGIVRYSSREHGYGQGGASGAMVGYVQNTDLDSVLLEVNRSVEENRLPLLVPSSAGGLQANSVNQLDHQFDRPTPPSPFSLRHLWVDLVGRSWN